MTTTAQHLDIKTILADRGLDGSGKDIWTKRLGEITEDEVKWALSRKPGYYVLDRLLMLISPAAENFHRANGANRSSAHAPAIR